MKVLQPEGWPRPKGYANGVSARGRMVFVAGMIGWDENEVFHSDDFAQQAQQALRNMLAVFELIFYPFVFIMLYAITSRVTQPIRRLSTRCGSKFSPITSSVEPPPISITSLRPFSG